MIVLTKVLRVAAKMVRVMARADAGLIVQVRCVRTTVVMATANSRILIARAGLALNQLPTAVVIISVRAVGAGITAPLTATVRVPLGVPMVLVH